MMDLQRAESWPALPTDAWAPTRHTLHMVSQMVGKVRLALAPPQPEWLHACLFLDARGLTTGAMPYRDSVVTVSIDLFDPALVIEVSDGRRAVVAIDASGSVAAIWAAFRAALAGLAIDVDVWGHPQELEDPTPFARDTTVRDFVAEDARRFHQVLCAVDGAFEVFRSSFFGRTGIQFWWGSFDMSVLLFSGRRSKAPDDRGYIIRYDLDAENLSAGFWPGDDDTPEPRLFAYIHPAPPGCEVAPIRPASATWAEAMGEWVLPYDEIRSLADPQAAIVEFLRSVYHVAITNGGWDGEAFAYDPPPAPRRLASDPDPA